MKMNVQSRKVVILRQQVVGFYHQIFLFITFYKVARHFQVTSLLRRIVLIHWNNLKGVMYWNRKEYRFQIVITVLAT